MNKPLLSLASILTLSISSLVAQTAGNLIAERWNNLPAGFSVRTLQNEGISKRVADTTTLLAGAEWTSGQGDYYGLRLRGTVTAPETGEYRFFVAGDDNAELFLSTDGSRFNKKRVAWTHAWTNAKQWDKYPGQKSAAVSLVAGQKYYIEAQLMEFNWGEHLSIGWAREPVNWALDASAVASQSSTGWGGAAERAIDGNTDGNYNAGSVTHTNHGTDNHWQVDLGQNREIRELVIWPRTSNMDRLSNFRVSILDDQGTELTGQDYYTQQGNVTLPNLRWVLPQAVTGRTVRIQFLGHNLSGNGLLSLAEVQVMSQYSTPVLVPASQLESLTADANDQDDDNLPDGWETANGLNASNAFGKEGEYGDFDNDGISNLLEYQLGTDPASKEALLDGLTRERWENISGIRISDLTHNRTRFLNHPNEKTHVPDINENNHGSDFGTRYRGSVTAPVTGEYTFWISGDDEAELWLADGTIVKDINGTATPLTSRYGKQKLAWIQDQRFGKNFTSDEDFDRFATQRSRTVHLTTGQSYYLEVLHKQSGGNDNVAVAWQVPGGQRETIPSFAYASDVPEDDDPDDDYLPSAWETQYGLNPADNGITDARDGQYGDWDDDGLTNFEEYQLDTDPTNADTDGDSLTDKEERDYYGTNPLVSNQLSSSLHTQMQLTQYLDSTNAWYENLDGHFVSSERRGVIQYGFTVESGEEGIYEVSITAGADGVVRSTEMLPLSLALNGNTISTLTLTSLNGGSDTLTRLTPWLEADTYTLVVTNTNYRAALRLRLEEVKVTHLGGLDANSNGTADWMEDKLANENRLTYAPSTSAVSPLCIEAVTPHLSLASLSKTVLDPQSGLPVQQSQPWIEGINEGAYANVELNSSGATEITASFQSGASVDTRQVTWTATNLLNTDTINIRKGDALKLTAHDGSQSGSFTMSLNFNPLASVTMPSEFQGYLPTTAATAVVAWPALDLNLVASASGTLNGASFGWQGYTATAYHFQKSGNTATFQLQLIGGAFTKCVKVQLQQDGAGIKAHQVYGRYKQGNHLGADFDTVPSNSMPSGSGGYGITSITLPVYPSLPGGTNLTPSGALAATQNIVQTFAFPGNHTLTAVWTPSDGSPAQTSTLAVNVLSADFGEGIDVMAWNRRTWTIPGIENNLVVEADNTLAWNETTEAGDESRSFTVDTYETGTRHTLARLPGGGAILARGDVRGFYIAAVDETSDATIVTQLPDGTYLMRMTYIAENLPANARIRIRSYYQGTTFLNGGNELDLSAADFDENGITHIYMEWADGTSAPRLCHYIDVFLD